MIFDDKFDFFFFFFSPFVIHESLDFSDLHVYVVTRNCFTPLGESGNKNKAFDTPVLAARCCQ